MYLFLPKSILKRIQSIMARFLWSNNLSGPCQFKVAWVDCCLPKDEGGFGFKELLSWNKSSIIFQICRIANNGKKFCGFPGSIPVFSSLRLFGR